jgi:SAM-dependent methyltransferase
VKTPHLARTFAVRATASAGYRLTRLSSRLQAQRVVGEQDEGLTLAGDRDVEWAWALSQLREEPGDVLDFGAGHGLLSLGAAFRGHRVVAVDLEEQSFQFTHDRIEYRRGDLNKLDIGTSSFDQILNCSTIEHVGLQGRYGAADDPNGDLRAMEKMASALRPAGTMVLTLPVGSDDVFAPYHRVYGATRLPALLAPFNILREEFRAKRASRKWEPVERGVALTTRGSAAYYAIGLLVLRPQ